MFFASCCLASPSACCLSEGWGLPLNSLATITLAIMRVLDWMEYVAVHCWLTWLLLLARDSRYSWELLVYTLVLVHTQTHKHAHTHTRMQTCSHSLSLSPILQAYYRRGVALQGLERHEEAMIVFAEGLAADPKQAPMLHGLIETMIKSPYRGECSEPITNVTRYFKA